MKTDSSPNLVDFYFGTIADEPRRQIEKEMLVDPEVLLDYLDLKRAIEKAAPVPAAPSPLLWRRLQPLNRKKKWTLVALTGLVAAGLAALFLLTQTKVETSTTNAVLFDSGPEHSFASDVL